MNLEKILELIMNGSDINIEYSNINGNQKLIVNGEEIKDDESFDSTEIVEKVNEFKDNLNALNNCLYVTVLDYIKDKYDLVTMNNLLEEKSFDKASAEAVCEFIDYANDVCKKVINERIKEYQKLLKRF